MKIDTTATILQLSQLLAASAGVGGAPVVAGDGSTPQPAVATAPQGAGQPASSFLQLLTQIQQAAAAEANPASPTPPDTKTSDAAPASSDNSSDPTSISNALLALLSQSNQPLPTNTPPVATTTAGSAPGMPGDVAVSAVSTGCPAITKPEANIAQTSTELPPAMPPAGDGKRQPVDLKNANSSMPTDSATGINIKGLEATPPGEDPPQVAAPVIPSPKPSSTDGKVVAAEINSIADAKSESPKIDVTQPQPAATNSLNSDVPQTPPADAVAPVDSRHTEIQPIEVKTPEVDRTRSAANSAATFHVVGDATIEVSGDIEPVESSSETVEVDDATHADAPDLNISGESVHGATELPTAIDPSSPPTTVDAHSLAHHLEEMVTQLSKSDSPDHTSVVLRLDPPELGRVNVHMTMSNDVVSIRMVASDDAARQVIERQLNDLQQSLNNQGISFQDCQVQVGSSGQQSSDRGLRKQWVDNTGYGAFTGRRAAIPSVSTRAPTSNLAQLDYVA